MQEKEHIIELTENCTKKKAQYYHIVEKREIFYQWKNISSNQLFSNFFSTVKSVLEAAASNLFDVIFGQNLLSKN